MANQRIDNPIVVSEDAELPDLAQLERGSEGLELVAEGRLAGEHPASVLRIPHHGRAGDNVHRRDGLACILLWRRKLYESRWMLWILLLMFPFPYIANTAGWMTAEIGRQPWLVYGLMRTVDGYSKMVSAGNGWFSFLGFAGCTPCCRCSSSSWFGARSSMGPSR